MTKIFGIVASACLIVWIERKNLRLHWDKRERASFFVSVFLGVSLTIAWSLGVNLWNPLDFFLWIYQPLSKSFLDYLRQIKSF